MNCLFFPYALIERVIGGGRWSLVIPYPFRRGFAKVKPVAGRDRLIRLSDLFHVSGAWLVIFWGVEMPRHGGSKG